MDILLLCVLARYIYVARKSEFIPELFSLAGIIFATFLGVHYYVGFGKLVDTYLVIPEMLSEFFAFSLIVILIILIFILICEGWLLVIKMKIHPWVDNILGFSLSMIRCYLICGLVFFALSLVHDKRIEGSVKHSLSSYLLKDTSATVYKVGYVGLFGKLFPEEKINVRVLRRDINDIRQERKARREQRLMEE